MRPDVPSIEFFFDIVSPYSYLASHRIDAVGARAGLPVRWRPFLLGGVFKATGNDMPARVPARGAYMLRDLDRWADRLEIPFQFPSFFPCNSLIPMRALTWLPEEERREAAQRIFHAHWAEARNPQDIELLAELLGRQPVVGAGEPEVKARLRQTTDEAVARGAFGAPSIFVGDQLFFGNDRMELVEDAARKLADR
jgi:2-hydroxychromene-2-carboxylate isomerase